MRKLLTIVLIFITSLGCAQPKSIKYYFQWLQAQDITNTRHFIWHGDTIDFNQMQLTDSILIAMTVDTLYIGNDTIYEGNFLLKRDSLTTWVTPKQLSDSLFSTIGHPPVTAGISAQTGGITIDSTQVLVFQSANGSRNGYLLAVDWANFNNKLSSVTHDETLDGLGTPASPLVVDTVSWVATKYDMSLGNIDSVLMASKNWVKTYVYNWGVDTLVTDWTGTFDGHEGTYYLNYNNLSNKPTIPIIENDAYGVTWDDDLDGATKNVIYDAIQGVLGGVAHNALSLDPIKQNGLELNTGTQVLGLDTANVSTTGALSKHDYTKFNTRVLSKSKTGNSVTVNINNGTGTTFSVADADSSVTNEIQGLSYTAATRALGITGGTGITLPLFSSSTTAAGLVPGGNNNGATYFLNATGNWTQPVGVTQWINDTYGIHYSTSNVGVGGDAVSGTKFNVINTDQSYAGKFTSGETSYGVSIYAGSTSEHAALYVGRYNGYELFSVRGDGRLFANLYGTGSFSGTANYLLGVDASGNIVETAGTGGGGGTITGTGASSKVAFWTGTTTLSNNSNLHWDNVNSRLGIGVTSPAYNLHTLGDIKVGLNSSDLKKVYFGDGTYVYVGEGTADDRLELAGTTLAIKVNGSAGSANQVLTSNGTTATWANAQSGFSNPMTTAGQMIIGGTGGTATALSAPGAPGLVLTSTGTTGAAWAAPSGGGSMVYPSSGIAVSTGSTWGTSIQTGTNDGTFLRKDGTWATPTTSGSSKWGEGTYHIYPLNNKVVSIGSTTIRSGRSLEVTGDMDIIANSAGSEILAIRNTGSGGGVLIETANDGVAALDISSMSLGANMFTVSDDGSYGNIYMPTIPASTVSESKILKWNPSTGKVAYSDASTGGDTYWSLTGTTLKPTSDSYNVTVGKSTSTGKKFEVAGSGEFSTDLYVGTSTSRGQKVNFSSTAVQVGEGSNGQLVLKGTTMQANINGVTGAKGYVLTADGAGNIGYKKSQITQTLTSSATITMDWDSGANAYVALEHNATLTLTNIPDGESGTLVIDQSTTAGNTLTIYGSTGYSIVRYRDGERLLSTSANTHDLISYKRIGSNLYLTYAQGWIY